MEVRAALDTGIDELAAQLNAWGALMEVEFH